MRSMPRVGAALVAMAIVVAGGCAGSTASDMKAGSVPAGGSASTPTQKMPPNTTPLEVLRQVVVKPSYQAPVYASPSEGAVELVAYPEGTVFAVLQEETMADGSTWLRVTGDFNEVVVADGTTVPHGWIKATVVETAA